MDAHNRKALDTIHRCINAGRVRLLPHFTTRMDERGLVWADVLAVIDEPTDIWNDGKDDWDRARWILTGRTADAQTIGLVCVIGRRARGDLTVFITMFWGKP